ncbi:GLE1-like protein [Colletotrichum graminicola]|uniref:mRNA export factor GLE1 n=1 Tax=Colletotrichum graminicola (strain M1.001 / M2 / FGSC 10212) TaxID=645133 RepID=E3QG12_COLGM|nr:GLE1-like protein [Colletotrichum graminicola M1.001]EFQ29847.1 GLE1-like protein [Colletotrichum graminicola M1.001]WDK12336.1 GLE1-like protein [Colletotrichum graminicola]
MPHSSPSRRSQQNGHIKSSPERAYVPDFLSENRNSELSHRDALAAAQLEHERVRLAALRVYEVHQLQEEKQRLEAEKRRIAQLQREEEERLKAEAAVRAEQERLRELKAKQIPQLPPEPEPEPPKPEPKKSQEPQVISTTEKAADKIETAAPVASKSQQASLTSTPAPALQAAKAPPSAPSPPPAKAPSVPDAQSNGFLTKPAELARPKTVAQSVAPAPAAQLTADRYIEIHQALKKLRKDVEALSKQPGSPLKGKLGDMRRQIRKSIGQLTAGKGANVTPINTINGALRESLDGRVPSPLVDANTYVQQNREPVEGAVNNGPQLPALFIYLLNILAKAIIQQFANEGGANPRSAEPVGIVTAQIFSNKDYQWRGASMIDILIAKFRVACPVLFGSRGSDKTENGRKAIGWKKEDGNWVPEQAHNDRMTGLGAGFAAIALRDFSKASKTNPYPPTNYWKAMAQIINSPPQLVSNTQYIVLKSMIDGHEQRFINFYGNAAIAALRMALVEFPKRAPPGATAAQALQVLADVLRRDSGLEVA